MDDSTAASQSNSALRVGFLVIGRKRPGFDMEWGQQVERAAWTATQSRFDAFQPDTRVVDDASLRLALDEIRQAKCDALVVLQPIMGDGRLSPVLAQLWDGAPIFWATPERPDGGKVSSCSLVGAHAFASTLRQLGRQFEIVYGSPEDAGTMNRLNAAVHLVSAAVKLRTSKIGLVGAHAPGFINMNVDPAAMSRQLGVELHHFGLDEFIGLVEEQTDEAIAQDVAQVEKLGIPFGAEIGPDDLPINSRYYLAMRSLLSGENLDALAVRCWPELPNRVGQWPYLAMARLAGEGESVALEGDVDGAVSSRIAWLLGLGAGYLSDWIEHDEHSITLWHPGHAPLNLCTPGSARLGRHFNTRHPLVVDAEMAADRPVTLFRVWRCDGSYRMTSCEAGTVKPRRELTGTNGLVSVDDRDVNRWFDHLCHEGMPHHLLVIPGHHSELLGRFARQIGISVLAAS